MAQGLISNVHFDARYNILILGSKDSSTIIYYNFLELITSSTYSELFIRTGNSLNRLFTLFS